MILLVDLTAELEKKNEQEKRMAINWCKSVGPLQRLRQGYRVCHSVGGDSGDARLVEIQSEFELWDRVRR